MLPPTTWSLLLLLAPLAAPLPQTLTPIPADSPSVHVNNMTTYGTGCPIGGGPIAQATKDGRPIFAFTEWGLSLPDPDSETPGAAEKWCSEEIDLGGGPVGMRMRIESVTVSGFATLGSGTKLAVGVETRLGGVEGGVSLFLFFFCSSLLGLGANSKTEEERGGWGGGAERGRVRGGARDGADGCLVRVRAGVGGGAASEHQGDGGAGRVRGGGWDVLGGDAGGRESRSEEGVEGEVYAGLAAVFEYGGVGAVVVGVKGAGGGRGLSVE